MGFSMAQRKKTIVVVGSGGAVGSVIVPALARSSLTGELRLVDHDLYEARNLASQQIRPSDVGLPKVVVGERDVRQSFPDVDVMPLHAPVESLPAGVLCCDLIIAAVDTRAARQYVNQTAWRLGVPWIDVGIGSWSMQARVALFIPGRDAACLECPWTAADYDSLEQSNSCTGPAVAPPTGAPFPLASFAASLAVLESTRLLSEDQDDSLSDCEIFHDLTARVQSVTRMRRTSQCRFDHEMWNVRPMNDAHGQMSLDQFVQRAADHVGGAVMSLKIEGAGFSTSFYCPACRESVCQPIRAARVAGDNNGMCPQCGQPLAAGAFDMIDAVQWRHVSPADRTRTLADWGVRAGEIIAVATDSEDVVHAMLPVSCPQCHPYTIKDLSP